MLARTTTTRPHVGLQASVRVSRIRTEPDFCLKYPGSDGGDPVGLDSLAMASVADTIIPVQDVLGLSSEARMNLPASQSGQLDLAIAARDNR